MMLGQDKAIRAIARVVDLKEVADLGAFLGRAVDSAFGA